MKQIIAVILASILFAAPLYSQPTPASGGTPATQAEVDAGTVNNKYVSPLTLTNWSGGGGGGDAELAGNNAFTGQNSFTLSPEIAWSSKATGSSTSAVNTFYYISAFTSNTTISSYVGTPANGTKVGYLLVGCNGTATFTFPAAQRAGDPTGASTVITPTPGTHFIVFTYINSAWYYQDDVVLNGVAVTGTFTAPTTTNPLALASYDCYNRVLFYGATGEIDLPAGAAGMNLLIYNTGAFTVTIDPNGSEVIVRDGTAQTGGVTMTLSSGAGNYVGMIFNGTQWVTLGYKGTLSQGS